jgi:hypothetical protein
MTDNTREDIRKLETALQTIHNQKIPHTPSANWQQNVLREVRKLETEKDQPWMATSLSRLLWPLVPAACCALFAVAFTFTNSGASDMDLLFWSMKQPLDVDVFYTLRLM